MSDPFADMRRGDRGALGRFLARHGAALIALRDALAPESDLEAVAVAVWKASLTALGNPDPLRHALASAAAALVPERPEEPVPQVNLSTFVFATSAAHLGCGGKREAGFAERALANEPKLADLERQVITALDAAVQAAGPTDRFEAAWATIEPKLR